MMYHQPQRNQMPHAPFYPYMPPQVYYGDDPARFSSPNGHWPLYDGSHSYPYPPVQCHGHGCCNHSYFPGHFAMRPPYPSHDHVSPAPSLYPFCHPAAQGMYPPANYFPPPRYEYDKDMFKGCGPHCCGWCQTHPSDGKQGGNVKIVEEEPEAEKKTNTNSSLVPFEAKNYTYPYPYQVSWLQPNSIMNAEQNKKSDDSRCNGLEKNLDARTSENQQQQPILWNGWFPYDMRRVKSSNQEEKTPSLRNCEISRRTPLASSNNQEHEEGAKSQQPTMWRGWFPSELSNMGSRKQDEERLGNQHQQDDDKQRNLPFPIFWMPYKPRVTEGEGKPEIFTENDLSKKKSSGEGKSPLHIINVPPEKHVENKEKPKMEIASEGPNVLERTIASEVPNVSNTNRVVKTIPVKQLKEQVEEDKKASSKIKEIEKKPFEEGNNKQPRKASKLPPVCLRVEPLPKRKGTHGNSRSPSPPGDKRKTYDMSGTVSVNLKTKEGREKQPEIAGDRSKVAEKRSKSAEIATEAANGSCKQGEVKLGSKSGDNVSHDSTIRKENGQLSNDDCKEDQSVDCDDGQKGNEDLEAKITAAEDHSLNAKYSTEEAEERKKIKFSDAEAATMIQAAYRGFEVRKSEPLKKLKKLAEVKEEVAGIRRRIQALESSCKVKDYDKEKIIVTETIMNLLLKLDAIQGLHESIRDVRKLIAKELVNLQETLDALVMEKSSPALSEQPSGISSEETLTDLRNDYTNIELENKDTVPDLSNIDNRVSPPEEKCEKQQVLETDSLPKSEDVENSVAMVGSDCLVDDLKDVSGGTSAEILHGALESTSIVGGDSKEHDDIQSPIMDSSHDDKELEFGQLSETQGLRKEISDSEDVSEEMGIEISNISPLGVRNQDPNTKDTSEDDHMSMEVAGHVVKDATKADEMIIASQEQDSSEERQEGSQEDEGEEKISDGVFPEKPHEVCGMQVLPLGDEYSVDNIPIEVPKEADNGRDTCEADETTRVDITKESERAAYDEPGREQRLEKCPIDVSSNINNGGQFEQAELEEEQMERDTGALQFVQSELQKEQLGGDTCAVCFEQAELRGEQLERDTGTMHFEQAELQKDRLEMETGSILEDTTTLMLHERGSVLPHDDIQVELQKKDHGLVTDSELRGNIVDTTGLVTISKEAIGGLREDHDHLLPNTSVQEDIGKNDYGLVPGESEAVPPFGVEESDEINVAADEMENIAPVVIPAGKMGETYLWRDAVPPFGVEESDDINVAADEMENISPVVIPAGKMGETYLSTDGSEGGQHVLAGANDQADELDLTAPSEAGSQASLESETVKENGRKLMEENEKLREMMEKLLEAGNKQLSTISELSSRVNDLEKRLATKKKKQLRIRRRSKALHPQGILV